MSMFWGVPTDVRIGDGGYMTVEEAIIDFHDNICDLKDVWLENDLANIDGSNVGGGSDWEREK